MVVLGFFLFNAQVCEPRLNWNATEKKGSSRGGGYSGRSRGRSSQHAVGDLNFFTHKR